MTVSAAIVGLVSSQRTSSKYFHKLYREYIRVPVTHPPRVYIEAPKPHFKRSDRSIVTCNWRQLEYKVFC